MTARASGGCRRVENKEGAGRRRRRLIRNVVTRKDGLTTAAIKLEVLWNQLAMTREFSLLCAYSMGNFY
jgi:hypothetical protein